MISLDLNFLILDDTVDKVSIQELQPWVSLLKVQLLWESRIWCSEWLIEEDLVLFIVFLKNQLNRFLNNSLRKLQMEIRLVLQET